MINRKLSLVFVGLISVLPSITVAEETAAKDEEKKSTTVVVTASRGKEQEALQVPQAVSVIDQSTLSSSSAVDVDAIVREVPNVNLAPAEGNPNFWQEGFTVRGLGGQRVLTLTDGVRQAGQGIGYGGGNLSLYDPFAIERIEILKGPGSVLYGTDAFGGVVNIITREPTRRDSAGSNGGFEYFWDGQYQKQRVGAYVDFGDENSSTIIGGSFTDADEPELPNDEDARSGDYRKWSAFIKSDYHFCEDAKLRIIGNWDRTTDVGIENTVIPLPIAIFPPPGSSELIFSPLKFSIPTYQRSLVGAEIELSDVSADLETLKSGFYWQQIRRALARETGYYNFGFPGFAGPPLFYVPGAAVNAASVLTNDQINTFEWNTQSRHEVDNQSIVAGIDLGYDTSYLPETEEITTLGLAGVGAVPPTFISSKSRVRADAEQYRIGLYIQDTINVGDFDVVPGARLDYFDVQDELSDYSDDLFGASGSIGTLYRATTNDNVFLNLTTGFRAPDLGERFQNGIVNFGAPTRIIGQADLDPERAYTAELGVKGEVARNYRYEVAAFGSKVNDYIGPKALGVVDNFVTEQYQNLGDVSLYGGEFGGSVYLTDEFQLYANGGKTWTNDRDKVSIPDWVFQYGPRYTIPVNAPGVKDVSVAMNFRTVLESREEIERPGQDPFDGDAFTVVDLDIVVATGETALGDGKILVGIKNLFDKEYEEPFFARLQPERNLYAGVRFDF